LKASVTEISDEFEIVLPYKARCANRGAIIIEPEGSEDVFDLPNDKLKKIVQGIVWCEEHFAGRAISEIARIKKHGSNYVRQSILEGLKFL